MNDGVSIPPAPPQPSAKPAAPEPAKVISLPPELPVGPLIKGDVVANEKGVLTLKTEQGLVQVEAKIDAAIGQKISFRLQLMGQQASAKLVAELLQVFTDKQATPTQMPKPVAMTQADAVRIPESKFLAEYTPLQAKIMALPSVLGDHEVELVLKSLLQLPQLSDLPQTLKEGLVKFRQLTGLMSQANLLPQQSLQPNGAGTELPKGLLTALQQLLTPNAKSAVSLIAQPGQNFVQLQTITPGQTISPNILLDVRQQLMSLLQPQTGGMVQPGQAPLYTMPAMGMVLGMQQNAQPAFAGNSLLFMSTPQGQQMIGLLSAADARALDKMLLPGTVLVMAFQPQGQKAVTLPVLPQGVLTDSMMTIMPLNVALGESWDSLEQVFDEILMRQADMPELAHIMRQTIPSPAPQHFPPAALLFLALLKNGLAGSWVQETVTETLEKIGKTELLKQLGSDLRAVQNSMDEPLPVDGWRPLPIPLQIGDQIMRLQFFYRHPDDGRQPDGEADDTVQKKQKTRFLVNVPKTSFGDIQIDGLVQVKDLEMILRTEEPLGSAAEGAIRSRYQAVLETTGMSGGINFQSGRHHYVRA